MKLSIIIPYYNTYKLTKKLLVCLCKQLTQNVEVILVDDGCNETRLDVFNKINIIHLDKNYGASHAWNVGLSKASGKYIGFIDSDDMISNDYISTLLNVINEHDVDEIVFKFYICKPNKIICLQKEPICRAIWKAIYKRWLIIPFEEDRKHHTDIPLHMHLMRTHHTKHFLDKAIYYYTCEREGSITWTYKHNKEEEMKKKKINISEVNGVEYNADLVKKYEENYIMEEEGIGANEEEPYDIQTTFETKADSKNIYGEGCEIDED